MTACSNIPSVFTAVFCCFFFFEDKHTFDTVAEAGGTFGREIIDRLVEMKPDCESMFVYLALMLFVVLFGL